MDDQFDVVRQSLQTQAGPYGEVALGVECAWPESIPHLAPAVAESEPE